MGAVKPKLEKLSWGEARKLVDDVNPELVQAIDRLDSSKDLYLYKLNYTYGTPILIKGVLQLQCEDGRTVPITDESVPSEFQKDQAYAQDVQTMPMGLVLKNSIELSLQVHDRTVPFSMMFPGKVFALWVVLEPNLSGRVWNISAGARSIAMLPKMSEKTSYRRLQTTFGLDAPIPRELGDHFDVFKGIANSDSVKDPWSVDLLLFSGQWLHEYSEPGWRLLRLYFYERAWKESAFLRHQVVTDYLFSLGLERKNLKPNPYLSNTVRHLYLIGEGAMPAYQIATNNIAAPIDLFQKALIDVYGLSEYYPSIVHLGYFGEKTEQYLYYSLELPTILDFQPRSRQRSSKLQDLRQIHHMLNCVSQEIDETVDEYITSTSPIYRVSRQVEFSCYHEQEDLAEGIYSTRDLVGSDPALQNEFDLARDLNFCSSSRFMRGCIGITNKHLLKKQKE